MTQKEDWENNMDRIERTLKLSQLELQWIVQHYFDDRPKGFGEQKLTFDSETRKAIGGYFAVIEALNSMRLEVGLDKLDK